MNPLFEALNAARNRVIGLLQLPHGFSIECLL